MLTDRNQTLEPSIWIHSEKKQMCAALSSKLDQKSQMVPINAPGLTGNFDIASGKERMMF